MKEDMIDKGLNALISLLCGFGIFLAFIIVTIILCIFVFKIIEKRKEKRRKEKR